MIEDINPTELAEAYKNMAANVEQIQPIAPPPKVSHPLPSSFEKKGKPDGISRTINDLIMEFLDEYLRDESYLHCEQLPYNQYTHHYNYHYFPPDVTARCWELAFAEAWEQVDYYCKLREITREELGARLATGALHPFAVVSACYHAKRQEPAEYNLATICGDQEVVAELTNSQRGYKTLNNETFKWLENNWQKLIKQSECKTLGTKAVEQLLKSRWDICLSKTTIGKYRNECEMFK